MYKSKNTLTILGSGTCVPSLERTSSSALCETADLKILIDTGHGTIRRLLECGVNINEIDIIFYTHLHPDHNCELIPFLFASKYGEKRTRKLEIYAAKGFLTFFTNLNSAYSNWLKSDLLSIKEIEGNESIQFKGVKITTASVNHHKSSLAYRFDTDNFSFTYSGDTDYSESLIELAKNSDLLVCECSFPDNMKKEGHLIPKLAGKIADLAKAKSLILNHFYPMCDKVDIVKECRKSYSGRIQKGVDLMEIKLTKEP